MGVGRGECPEGKIVSSGLDTGCWLTLKVCNNFYLNYLKICLKSIGKNNYQCKFSKRPWCQAKSRRSGAEVGKTVPLLSGVYSTNSEQANPNDVIAVVTDDYGQWKPELTPERAIVEAPAFNGWSKTSSLRTWLLSWSLKKAKHSSGKGWLAPEWTLTSRTKAGDKREVSNREIEKGIILNIRWDNESRRVIRKIDN